MPSTAKKLRNAEEKVSKAQAVLDKAQTGLHAAEEVAATAEKASRHPVLITLGVILIVGAIWMLVKARTEA